MKDKRISLRFREDNTLESEAWKRLEDYAKKKNISKNAALIALILSGGITDDSMDSSMDKFAERVADTVAQKLNDRWKLVQASGGAKEAVVETSDVLQAVSETMPETDEPQLLGEDVIGFLDMFG